ncbi:hypothetical protein [Brevundimonas olei]|uniref:hypothetical protein n=1 Tax=Brevundimonas olei TaxID=657642 RepID=UPI0031D5D694
MAWKDDLDSAFGAVDRKLAVHPSDRKVAKQVIKEAKAAGDTFDDLEKEIVWNCYKHVTAPGALQSHIAEQVKTAKALW